jgi:nucleoid-associated protein YgaU
MFVRIVLLLAAAALVVAVAARQSSGAGHPHKYRVRAGDTLWSIASAHYAGDPREAVWRIERRNHLLAAALEPGQVLVLPAG